MASYEGPYFGTDMFKSFTKTWHRNPYPSISPSRPELSAAGKIVFITGGGSGIGKATAIGFAQAGAKAIAIFGRRIGNLKSTAEEIKKANPAGTTKVIFESADISQRQSLETAFANALSKAGGGKIDVIVNNAGSLKPGSPVTVYPEKDLRDSIESNLIGSYYVIQAATPLLASNAKVLNVSSGIGHMNPIPGLWVYASLKIALIKMFDFLQAENPDLNVFNIQPGVVETELNQVSKFPGQDDVNLPGHFHVWLASPEAGFLKGKFIWANWDVDEMKTLSKVVQDSMLLRVTLEGVPI
ncbi:hypothetical protein IFR04_003364 [Cadophora malorum]|uniref:NAD(P)-binding protein n=1 Tax=Cadophora malorum TaxID=108018 RepID=A0A8H7WEZ4_9HELO|nr:hypothetical protein IFR04_003364 [Cadophora malorum]